MRERFEEAGLTPPRRVTVAVTAGCNLRCGHCYVESAPSEGAKFVPGGAVRRLLREFAALGATEAHLTGGEPLLHPEWANLVAFAGQEAGFREVRLQTNATLLDERAAGTLAALALPGLTVQVSLEGADPGAHDRVRGEGSFERAVRGLGALAEAGLGAHVLVAVTEMRHNVDRIAELLDLLEGLGIRRAVSSSLTPHGRAAGSCSLAPPTPEQYRRLLDRHASDEAFAARCRGWAEVTAVRWLEGRGRPTGSVCSLAVNPYVGTDGCLYPCPLLHAPEFATQGVWDGPLAEALEEALPRWADLQLVSRRRPGAIPECRECPDLGHCGAGCMGRAHMGRGSLYAPEDRCELRRGVYGWNPAPGGAG